MAPDLVSTVKAVVPELRRICAGRWVVIGSAAACLLGLEGPVADVDVLVEADDAERLAEAWRERVDPGYRPDDDARFRSRFARYRFTGCLPVEVMGALECHDGQAWRQVACAAVTAVRAGGVDVVVPALDEQLRLLDLFGRPKDALRAAGLRSLLRSER